MELELQHPESVPNKRCPMCRQTKPLEEFPRNRATKSGLVTYGKPCHNQRTKATAERLYGGNANFLRVKRYGVSTDEFRAMIEKQGGLCAICRAKPARHLDHDHTTGALRSWLCFSCNRGLGKAEDDIRILQAAIQYLKGHAAPQSDSSAKPTRIGSDGT